jgi:hypothetical protein
VKREVGLLEHGHAADSLGGELVYDKLDQSRLSGRGRRGQEVPNLLHVVEDSPMTAPILSE